MLSTTNFWMCFAGVIYLILGLYIYRKEFAAAHGLDKLIALGPIFIAVSLALFAPEHFRGPQFVQDMVPSWMPGHLFWVYFVGCALLAAATSLTLRKCERWSTTLLGLMFFLFVCIIYIRSPLAHPANRFAWAYALRDLSFAAGAWAFAGLHSRASSPAQSRWMIRFARVVIGIAALVFAVDHFLHPAFAPGVPLEKVTPAWVPFPAFWGYLTGVIFLAAALCLLLNRYSRTAAASIGAWVTVLTLSLYLMMLILAHGESEISEALNYLADTLLFAGSALALAAALPSQPDRVVKP